MKNEIKIFLILLLIFLLGFFLPFENNIIKNAFQEAFLMFQEYTREHILTCLIPAFFIAGAISIFLSQGIILKYLGADSPKIISYSIASVSGCILAVCSCTVLPLFAGIYKRGAGLGPAISFLYSGPAINILSMVLTFKILGFDIGIARMIGAIIFAVVIGLIMHFIFRKEIENNKNSEQFSSQSDIDNKSTWKYILNIFLMILLLVFASWSKPEDGNYFLYSLIYKYKWYLAGLFLLIIIIWSLFLLKKQELTDWFSSTWDFAKKILPLLFGGVLVAGFLMGRPDHTALIPSKWVLSLVGENDIVSVLIASVSGGLMYFATLTEIPILQSLMGAGMAKGPALALLLAGPAVSLPNMLVIRSIIGNKKTVIYILLVIIMASITGWIYGLI